jgi:Flp pilus assembly protein TadG
VLVILVLATIEASNMIFLKQALTHAAYEAARVASHHSTKNPEPGVFATDILTARNIEQATFAMTPSDIEGLTRGNNIVVTVTAPSDANSLVPFTQFGSQTLSVSMTSVKN